MNRFTRQDFRKRSAFWRRMIEHSSTADGMAVKAILFDLDNTLIETSRAGEVALKKVIK